jgi:hypothetical protein
MASARRTFDTDSITLRTVFAKNGQNTNIPALRALTADGSGGTYWTQPSSFGTNYSFNQITTGAGTFTADLSYNTFSFLPGEGIGMYAGTGLNQIYMYAKAFSQIDVSGNNSLYAYSNATLTPSFKIATTGGVQLRTNVETNTLFLDGPLTTQISSGYYGFNKIFVVPSVSTIQTAIPSAEGRYLTANSPSTQLTLAGIGDLQLSSFYSTNQVFFNLSSFTAQGYQGLSGEIYNLNSNLLSSISSQFVTRLEFSTGVGAVSTISYSNASSVNSTIQGISSFFAVQFSNLTGLINARALQVQLDYEVTKFTTAISSFSTNYVDYTAYTSSAGGLVNQVSSVIFISGVSTIYLFGGSLYNFSAGSIVYDQSDVSTLSTSVNRRIESTSNYYSTNLVGNLNSTFSTITGLGTLGYLSSPQNLTSTVNGLATLGYVSSTQLTSTVRGLGSIGYVSTSGFNTALTSTTQGIVDSLGSLGYTSTATLNSTLQSTSKGITDYLGTNGYISTASFASTLASTTQGIFNEMGSYGYISTQTLTSSLVSTVTGLGIFYVSTQGLDQVLRSTSIDAFNKGYISSATLQSSITGLATAGYVSTASFLSITAAKYSLTSSMVYVGSNGSVNTSSNADYDMLFTTATFALDYLSSFLLSTSKVTVDFNIPAIFSDAKSETTGRTLYDFSTILLNGTSIVPSTTYSDKIYGAANICNFYTRNLMLPMQAPYLLSNIRSTFTMYHRVLVGYYDASGNDQGFLNNNITLGISANNSLFVTILN